MLLISKEYLLLISLPALYIDSKGLDALVSAIANAYSNKEAATETEEILQYADISAWQKRIA